MLTMTSDFADALDDPLTYMRAAHHAYLSRYLGSDGQVGPRRYLILGMNPGPWGMVQTGVPFGDVPNAYTILAAIGGEPSTLEPQLDRVKLHPRRPVQGFACKRVEDSGQRLWAGLGAVWSPDPRVRRTGLLGVKWFEAKDRRAAVSWARRFLQGREADDDDVDDSDDCWLFDEKYGAP